MARIIVRNTAISGSIPTSLVQGELSLNVTDGKLYYGSSSRNIVKEFTGSASGGGGGTFNTGSFVTTSSFNAFTSSYTTGSFTGSFTGSLFGTASFASTASFITGSTNAFIQNGNSFGATALLGTNDNQSLALETSGSTRMFISSSGNVGIGTTAPTVALQVGDTTSTGNYIRVLGTGSAADTTYDVFVGARRYPRLQLQDTTVGGSTFQMWSLGNTMRFGTDTGTQGNSAWFTKAGIAADVIFNGKLGIGISTPTTSLHISGASSVALLQVGSPASSNIIFVSGSGNVGIGTSTPATKFEVAGTSSFQNIITPTHATYDIGVNATRFRDGWFSRNLHTSTTWTNNIAFETTDLTVYNSTGTQIVGKWFGTTGNLALQSGSTTAPVDDTINRLQVSGSARITNGLTVTGSTLLTNGQTTIRGAGATSATTALLVQNSTPTTLFSILDNGNVGIATTTPAARLDVSGSVNISGSGVQVPFQVYSGVTPIMQVSSSGKISIGSATNAGYALEVYDTGIYYAGASQAGQLLITTSGSVNREGAFIAASTGRTLQMGINDNSTVPVGIDMFETNNDFPSSYLNFRVNNANLVRMTGSFVGIGTTTPSTTLDVSGSGRFTNGLTVTGSLIATTITGSLFGTSSYALTSSFLNGGTNGFIQNGNSFGTTATLGTNDNQSLALETNGSTRMFISSSGNVGIGTTTPNYKLHITGSDTSGSFNADGTLIVSGSNVGIGTTTPTVPLEIGRTSGGTQAKLRLWSGNTQWVQLEGGDSILDYNLNGVYSAVLSRNGGQRFTIPSNSVLGWAAAIGGSSPVGVNETTLSRWSAGVVAVGSGSVSNASGSLLAKTIGVGTLTPNATLDVNGNAIITGSLVVTTGITGSLFGTASFAVSASHAITASYATQALSASYAPSTPAFPFVGSAQITGSLLLSGSLTLSNYTNSGSFPGTGSAMLVVNNSGSVITQAFRDVAEQVYTGSIAWTGTAAPSGSTTHTYRWSQIGKTVNLNIVLNYTGPGNAVSTVTTALPADCPTPYISSGQSGAGALISVVSAHLTTTNTIGANVARGGLRINPTNNGYELSATAAASGYKLLVTSVQYFAV